MLIKLQEISRKPIHLFWFLQLCFWGFVSLISLFSLTLWYGEINILHISHTLIQSLFGVLLTLPLYWYFMQCWHWPILRRVVSIILVVLLMSLLWTIIRVYLYVQMTGFDDIWGDLGGWYFGSIFIYYCWTGFFHGIRYYLLLQTEHQLLLNKTAEAEKEFQKRLAAQTEARKAQIKMLRYQLNPHFLCNTLTAINALIECEQTEQAQKMTVQLSKFLRYSLDNNPDTQIALQFELKALDLYLDIEKTRFGDRLKLDFQVSKAAKKGLIPSLLLQPIIENSMKHVIAKCESGGTLTLRADVVNQQLVITICDTGNGEQLHRQQLKDQSNRGIGLRNIDERLKVLFNDQYQFDLSINDAGALSTCIKIPYEIDTNLS